jgi:hypothetical protein
LGAYTNANYAPTLSRIAQTQKLREVISGTSIPLGSSETGSAWALKALHPSDPGLPSSGWPDRSSVPSTILNFQMTRKLSPPSSATGWSADVTILPDPVCFATVAYRNNDMSNQYASFNNSQLGADTSIVGADYTTCLGKLLDSASAWRIAYMGVTVYQDGPDLANQGSVVAAQYPMHPVLCNPVGHFTPSSVTHAGAKNVATYDGPYFGRHGISYDFETGMPEFGQLQAMPNAYFGESKNGVYMPLRLTEDAMRWRGPNDVCHLLPHTLEAFSVNHYTAQTKSSSHSTLVQNYFTPCGTFALREDGSGKQFPYWNLTTAYMDTNPDAVTSDDFSGVIAGDIVAAPLSTHFGAMCFQNISGSANLVFYFRMGIEIQTWPGSQYSSFLKLSSPEDEVALSSYFAISRQLKDAYPSEYNDLGKLWAVIKEIARRALPTALKFLGPAGSVIGSGIKLFLEPSEKSETRSESRMPSKTGPRDKPTQADVERVQRSIGSVSAKSKRTLKIQRKT